jgi:hypothetical protein
MSALPPIADIAERDRDVRFVPEADIPQRREAAGGHYPRLALRGEFVTLSYAQRTPGFQP